MKRCINCFRQYENEYTICPYCGEAEIKEPLSPTHLRPGTEIHNGRYVIGLSVGSGGFGVVYRAWDRNLSTVVAIKEFYKPNVMVRAEGDTYISVYKSKIDEYEFNKKRFLAEARAMARFGGIATIPRVYDYFEENNTAYISMELFKGVSLRKYLNQKDGKKVAPEFAVYVATEVAKSLKVMHQHNVIHRDVAPDNIFLNEKGNEENEINVIDLGTARLADDTDASIQIEVKHGYTPVEQYDHAQKDIGPWTDIYALGATLYNMLTGILPAESTDRKTAAERKEPDPVKPPHEIDPSISVDLSNAVMRAMAIDRSLRISNADDFIKAINGQKRVLNPADEKKRRRNTRVFGIAAALLTVLAIGIAVGGVFAKEGKELYLNPTTVSVWISVDDGSTEEAATQNVLDDFKEKYPGVEFSLRAIPSTEYLAELETAANNNQLPNLFESTGIPDELLQNALSVSSVLESEQAKECKFLSHLDRNGKRIPLGIEVPIAAIITNGETKLEYQNDFFHDIADFGKDAIISADPNIETLLENNYGRINWESPELFLDNTDNRASVYLTSTMAINSIRNNLTNYAKRFVYYDNRSISCRFTYEWSIGPGDEDQVAATERLLSWMLGNVYQNTLMISMCSDGQIPTNEKCFQEKTNSQYLKPIKDIFNKFVFSE